jgi:hypothetical protein
MISTAPPAIIHQCFFVYQELWEERFKTVLPDRLAIKSRGLWAENPTRLSFSNQNAGLLGVLGGDTLI